jgi:hypothetical protein
MVHTGTEFILFEIGVGLDVVDSGAESLRKGSKRVGRHSRLVVMLVLTLLASTGMWGRISSGDGCNCASSQLPS